LRLGGLTCSLFHRFLAGLVNIDGLSFDWFLAGYFEFALRLALRDAPSLTGLDRLVENLCKEPRKDPAGKHTVRLLRGPVFHCLETVADHDIGVCLVEVYHVNLHLPQSKIGIFEGRVYYIL